MHDRKFQFFILIGALVLTGLFFFWMPTKKKVTDLQPSDLDFKQGNYPQRDQQPESVQLPAPVQIQTQNQLSPEDQKKLELVQEILNSKNDNDPRIDQELKDLSLEMHRALHQAYETLPMENRNGRGMVAFLIARDLKTKEDLEFLKKIYQENPCLSFQNCSVAAQADPHFDGINQTSLNYPQLAAIFQLQRRLESNSALLNNPDMKNLVADLLREARQFPADGVQKRAEEILKQYGL